MIFATGLKKIYEAISKNPAESQGKLFAKLEEKLITSKPLAYKFDLVESIKSKKGRFSAETADKYIAYLRNKHNAFLQENAGVALFYKEEKKLLEFFNINTADIQPNELDLVVNKKDNRLNEAIIKSYITDDRLISKKEYFAHKKEAIRECFKHIKNDLDTDLMERQIARIEFTSKRVNPKYKDMITASLGVIKEEVFTDFKSAVEKGYKLRIITEKLLREFPGDEASAAPAPQQSSVLTPSAPVADDDRISDKDWDKMEELDIAEIKLNDVGKFKKILVELPMGNDLTGVELNFNLPIYPRAATMANLMIESRKLDKVFQEMKGVFQRNILHKIASPYLSPMELIWETFVEGKNNNPQNEKDATGKQIVAQGFYSVNVKFDVIISLKKRADQETLLAEITKALQLFSTFIEGYDKISDIMTPEAQKGALAMATGGRSTEYNSVGEDKYYKDKHGEQSDTWTDDILSGEADESEIGNNQDLEFFGDGGRKAKAPKPAKATKGPIAQKQAPVGAIEDFDDTAGAAQNEFGFDDDDEDF